MTVLEGVSNFFNFLFTRLAYSWNLFVVIALILVLIGLQVGIVTIYVKLTTFISRLKFPITYWFRKLMS